jgi:hypothetical protein
MNLRYWPVTNSSGEEIPAFACMQLAGFTLAADNSYAYDAVKPTRFGAQYQHVFNGPTPIPIGKTGVAVSGEMVAALYDTADGDVNPLESLGPRSGSWKLRRNTGGFASGSALATEVVRVISQPLLSVIGKTDGEIFKTTTGTVSVYWRNYGDSISTLTDTGVNVTAISRYANVESGKYVQLTWMPWEWWEITTIEPVTVALYTT